MESSNIEYIESYNTDLIEIIENAENAENAETNTLIYDNELFNTKNKTNILLIDSRVINYEIFANSCNDDTYPIIYSKKTTRDELLNVISSKYTNINRIGFVFHGINENTYSFFNNEKLFINTDIYNNDNIPYSNNVNFLIDLITQFNITNIDFLACSTLLYSNWNNYYELLHNETNVVIGATNNDTGNEPNGDWLLESTGENIKPSYFTDNINNYNNLLTTTTINGIIYTYESVGYTSYVTDFTEDIPTSVTIPSIINVGGNNYDVNSIGSSAFEYCSALVSISIPNSVTSIGTFAFANCGSLATVTLSSHASFTTMSNSTFKNCSALTSITIPSNITTIDNNAFNNTGLTSITLPNTVSTVNSSAFKNCNKLVSVTLSSHTSFTTLSSNLFFACAALTSITIPSNITTIDTGVFEYCFALPSISIPNSVTSIGTLAFTNCNSLATVTLSSHASFTTMSNSIFKHTVALTSITIPSNITTIENDAFYNSGLTSITLPNTVETCNGNVFARCISLATVTLSSHASFTNITSFIFKDCTALTSITIPSNITTIKNDAFYNSGLTSITIPNTVSTINYSAFQDCSSLATATLSSHASFTTISNSIFKNCAALTSITIPSNITTIDNNAFNNTGLTSITLPNTVSTVNYGAFQDCSSLATVTLSSHASFTTISNSIFKNCAALTSITIPSNITTIDNNAFNNTGLTSITLPNTVSTVNYGAFQDCSSLATATLSSHASFTIINTDLFNGCTTLNNIVLPLNITTINDSAFKDCSALTDIIFPNDIATLGNTIFQNATLLNVISWEEPSNVSSIGTDIFDGITNSMDVTYYLTADYDSLNATSKSLQSQYPAETEYTYISGPSCYAVGTKILCLINNMEQYLNIENIKKGTLVKTYKQGYVSVELIGKSKIINRTNNKLSCMYKLKNGNLTVTGGHSILVNELPQYITDNPCGFYKNNYIINGKPLLLACDSELFEQITYVKQFTTYHLVLDVTKLSPEQLMFGIYVNDDILSETTSKDWFIHHKFKNTG